MSDSNGDHEFLPLSEDSLAIDGSRSGKYCFLWGYFLWETTQVQIDYPAPKHILVSLRGFRTLFLKKRSMWTCDGKVVQGIWENVGEKMVVVL